MPITNCPKCGLLYEDSEEAGNDPGRLCIHCYKQTRREDPYCRECGSDNLTYVEQYANGIEYRCRVCKAVQMW